MDCKRKPEIVVIENIGDSAANLGAWRIEDEGPNHTFFFPMGFSLDSGHSVELISGLPGDDSKSTIYWTERTVWNNDGDSGSLFDSSGQLRSQMKCS